MQTACSQGVRPCLLTLSCLNAVLETERAHFFSKMHEDFGYSKSIPPCKRNAFCLEPCEKEMVTFPLGELIREKVKPTE